MDGFLERLTDYVATHALLEPGQPVLVGVSGGVDSTVLLHGLHRLGHPVHVAHVNYGLRGEASEGDERHVRASCDTLRCPFHHYRPDTHDHAARHGQSIQEAARALRYAYFNETAKARGLTRVAVAHHVDDQAETVLLNLLRGTGPEGLAGMSPRRPLAGDEGVQLVRPLLWARRAEVEAFARGAGLPWRDDATNSNPKYRRSAVREALLPVIEAHFGPGTSTRIARAATHLRAYLDAAGTPALRSSFEEATLPARTGGRLSVAALQEMAPPWRRRVLLEALRNWLPTAPRTAAFVAQVDHLFGAQPGRRVVLPDGLVWRDRDALHFAPDAPMDGAPMDGAGAPALPLVPGAPATLPGGSLVVTVLSQAPRTLHAGADTVYVDLDCMDAPLAARPWQAGDRFRPFGMRGTKKVSDLLTDARVPVHQRRDAWVVLAGDRIVWLVGHRMADHVRVRPETVRFAKITFNRRDDIPPPGDAPTNSSAPDVP